MLLKWVTSSQGVRVDRPQEMTLENKEKYIVEGLVVDIIGMVPRGLTKASGAKERRRGIWGLTIGCIRRTSIKEFDKRSGFRIQPGDFLRTYLRFRG